MLIFLYVSRLFFHKNARLFVCGSTVFVVLHAKLTSADLKCAFRQLSLLFLHLIEILLALEYSTIYCTVYRINPKYTVQ